MEGLAKGQVLLLHNEGEEVPPCLAGPKAVPALPLREDVEGGALLLVEGTEGAEVPARLLDFYITRDDLGNIQLLLDFLYGAHGNEAWAISWASRRAKGSVMPAM